jgi:hypothetical protein
MSDLNFGDIVESNFVYTERALDKREYGRSEIKLRRDIYNFRNGTSLAGKPKRGRACLVYNIC